MLSFVRKYLFIFPLLCGGYGFSQPQGTTTKTAVIDRTESFKSHSSHTYQVFVPSVETTNKQLPLLVSIDSHGDGKLAVNGFKEAAQKYNVVVVGSNLIKNNDANYIQELEELIADAKSRYPIGNIIYIGGFSGGARMAIGYASTHQVNGVIACGALAQPEEITLLKCRVMSIIGMDDFNFMEAAQYVLNPDKMPSTLAIMTTKASHAWPEKKLLQQALGYLSLSTEASSQTNQQSQIKKYSAEQKQLIDVLNGSNETLQAALIAHNMAGVPLFEKESSFLSLYKELTQKEIYKKQIVALNQSILFESKVREGYYNALLQKDSAWWKNEITSLNTKIGSEKDVFTLMAYHRIKGFLGIVCFSLSNRFASEKDIKKLEQILSVYRLVEPNNADMKNYSEILIGLKANRSK